MFGYYVSMQSYIPLYSVRHTTRYTVLRRQLTLRSPATSAVRRPPQDKENKESQLKSHLGIESPVRPARGSGQVTVTLTLTSEKAQDVGAVLRSLATLLNISPPSGYQVIERTGTPPSQRLGLYRQARGKDGRDQGESGGG